MDSKTHLIVGAVVGGGTYLAMKSQRNEQAKLGEVIACAMAGAVVALLPDMLEPATGPFHRGLLHSAAAGAGLVYLSRQIWRMAEFPESERILYLVGCVAYLSHLVLDLSTPARLPIV